MADKYKLKPGEKATVTIELPEPPPAKPRRGYLGEEEIFYPSRRLQQDGIFVKFFDIGQLANGAENAFPTIFLDHTPFDPYTDTAGGAHTDLNPHAISWPFANTNHTDAYNSFLLAGDQDDWEDQYKEVLAEENIQFSADYLDTSTYVSEKGYLMVPNMSDDDPYKIGFTDGGGTELLWHRFTTAGDAEMKITRNPDYDDTEVDLVMDGNSSVFLVPSLKHFDGRAGSQRNAFGSVWSLEFIYMFGHYVKQVPRAFIQNNSVFEDYWAMPMRPDPGGTGPVKLSTDAAVSAAWYDLVTSEPGATCDIFDHWSWLFAGSNPATILSYVSTGTGDFSDVLAPGFTYGAQFLGSNLPPGDTGNEYVTDLPHVRWFGWYRNAGQLVAVVNKKRGSNSGWYYIWNNQDSETATLSPHYPVTDRIYARLWNQASWGAGLDQGVSVRLHNT